MAQVNSNVMYRPATSDDVPFVVSLLRQFYAKVGGLYKIDFCERSTREWAQLVADNGILLVGPASCAGAVILPFWLNSRASAAHVEFWYFRSAREITIFDALCEACRRAGATHIFTSGQFQAPAVRRFYQEKGLHGCATQFMGCL